ncbi:MAG: response regulator [Desulfovibrionaceae bacterium]
MPATILVLDDDLQVRFNLVAHLEDEDFDILEAGSSEDALTVLDDAEADLVIVDLRLPGMDGAAFIKTASARWPGLRFIVYTGSPEFRIPPNLTLLPNVSNTVFLKPLSDLDHLVSEIRRMLDEIA